MYLVAETIIYILTLVFKYFSIFLKPKDDYVVLHSRQIHEHNNRDELNLMTLFFQKTPSPISKNPVPNLHFIKHFI